MWNKLRNERGMLLPDLVASLPLGVIVLTVMTLSVINFLVAFNDVRDYTQLQDELFQAVETLRYGYVQSGVNTNSVALCGLMTANQVKLGDSRSSMELEVDSNPAFPIRSRYWIDSNGMMKMRGNYGSQLFSSSITNSNDIPIFPISDRKVGGALKFQILNPESAFTPLRVDAASNSTVRYVRLLGVDIRAQVRFREREDGQSASDDLRMNTRQIRYQTKIFVPNTPSQV